MNGVSPGCREIDENGEKPHKKNAEAGYLERKRHNRSDFWRRRKKVSDSPVKELGARLNAVSRKPDHPKKVRKCGDESVLLGRRLVALALVDLPVSPQVRDDGEVAATALDLASECYNTRQLQVN